MEDYGDTELIETLQGVLPLAVGVVSACLVLALAVALGRYYLSAQPGDRRLSELVSRSGNTLAIGVGCFLLIGGLGTALATYMLYGGEASPLDQSIRAAASTSTGSARLTAVEEAWQVSSGTSTYVSTSAAVEELLADEGLSSFLAAWSDYGYSYGVSLSDGVVTVDVYGGEGVVVATYAYDASSVEGSVLASAVMSSSALADVAEALEDEYVETLYEAAAEAVSEVVAGVSSAASSVLEAATSAASAIREGLASAGAALLSFLGLSSDADAEEVADAAEEAVEGYEAYCAALAAAVAGCDAANAGVSESGWAAALLYLESVGLEDYGQLEDLCSSDPEAYDAVVTALLGFGIASLADDVLWDEGYRAAVAAYTADVQHAVEELSEMES